MTAQKTFKVKGQVWRYHGPAAWYFVTLPAKQSKQIKFHAADQQSAWGSVRVKAKIGKTSWKTSLFPDSKAAAYLLPIKADVRRKEKLEAGSDVNITLLIGVIE